MYNIGLDELDSLELFNSMNKDEDKDIKKKHASVNHPSHYNTGEIEVIDYIADKLGKDGFEDYCIGNVIKYVSRYKHKNGKEDLEKAFTYLRWAIDKKVN